MLSLKHRYIYTILLYSDKNLGGGVISELISPYRSLLAEGILDPSDSLGSHANRKKYYLKLPLAKGRVKISFQNNQVK